MSNRKSDNKRISLPARNADELKDMPRWMDCSWRRQGCGRKDCPICGRLPDMGAGHAHDGRVPSWEDLGNILAEALTTVKAEAKRAGLTAKDLAAVENPPSPGSFPLYRKVDRWRQGVFAIADESDDVSSAWLFTEAGEDLLWYADTMTAKTYRQLTNRWHIKQGDGFGEFDLRYTGYVLEQTIDILKQSLIKLIGTDSEHKNKFNLVYLVLTAFENDIRKI